jgi:hypothetical protein
MPDLNKWQNKRNLKQKLIVNDEILQTFGMTSDDKYSYILVKLDRIYSSC